MNRKLTLAVSIALTMGSTLAHAHAHLKTADPAPDATVAQGARTLTIHYTEGLEPSFSKIVVTNAAGQSVAAAPSQVDTTDKASMHVELKALQAGAYKVHWNAVADDGHHTAGDYTFTVK